MLFTDLGPKEKVEVILTPNLRGTSFEVSWNPLQGLTLLSGNVDLKPFLKLVNSVLAEQDVEQLGVLMSLKFSGTELVKGLNIHSTLFSDGNSEPKEVATHRTFPGEVTRTLDMANKRDFERTVNTFKSSLDPFKFDGVILKRFGDKPLNVKIPR